MRVTNNMIMKNAASNINTTKEVVNQRNTQMTTQKKISRPSDDPVIAVRSLRLSTTLSQVNQYYGKNIPDATSWLDVTEAALINTRKAIMDCRTLAVNGSTDSLSETDRKTIYNQLEALQKTIYDEGNASYAGRTVFTGFRTDRNLTFTEDETETAYKITQTFSIGKTMESRRYYDGNVEVPTTQAGVLGNDISDTAQTEFYRNRLSYDGIDADGLSKFEITFSNDTKFTYEIGQAPVQDLTDSDGTPVTAWMVSTYETENDWAAESYARHSELGKVVEDNEIVFIEETGEFIYGKDVAAMMMKNDAKLTAEYTKTGFSKGQLRPEYYFDCVKTADPDDVSVPVTYTKFDEKGDVIAFDIKYAVSAGQTLSVNTEASNVFDSSFQRDLGEMLNAVNKSIKAHDKVTTIKSMMEETQYASEDYQEKLKKWLDAAQKEADYADDNMQKLYNEEIGKIDAYKDKMSLAITDLGCKVDSLKLTKTRMGDQQETVQELQSKNDDVDLSQIIIDYTAAYTAYQASLTAASKLGDSTLLNYL